MPRDFIRSAYDTIIGGAFQKKTYIDIFIYICENVLSENFLIYTLFLYASNCEYVISTHCGIGKLHWKYII